MLGTISLEDCLAKIESDKWEEAKSGLLDLKELIGSSPQPQTGPSHGLSSVRQTLSVLVDAIARERRNLCKPIGRSLKEKYADRLSLLASMLYLVTKTYVLVLTAKDVRIILEQIVEQIKMPESGICEPLCLDYMKTQRVLCDHRPHLEHLPLQLWADCVDLCLHIMGGFGILRDSKVLNSNISRNIRLESASVIFDLAQEVKVTPTCVRESVSCLSILVSSPSCPIFQRATIVLVVLTSFLTRGSGSTPAIKSALEAINAILPRISTEKTLQMPDWISLIFPILNDLWVRQRSPEIQDEVLKSLLQAETFLSSTQKKLSQDLLNIIEKLYESFRKDLLDISSKINLDLDDLYLRSGSALSLDILPMRITSFVLSLPTAKSERDWTILYFTGYMGSLLDATKQHKIDKLSEVSQHSSSKRLRRTSILDDTLEQLSSSPAKRRTSSLQLLCFYIYHSDWLAADVIDNICHSLLPHIRSDNGVESSWAMLVAACCTFHPALLGLSISEIWATIWDATSGLITSPMRSRAACHLLTGLIVTHRISSPLVSEMMETIFSSIQFRGPVTVAEATLAFLRTLLNVGSLLSTDSAAALRYEQYVLWFCQRWAPSNLESRQYVTECAKSLTVRHVLLAFAELLPTSWDPQHWQSFPCLGSLGQIWLQQSRLAPLFSDLFQLQNTRQKLPHNEAFLSETSHNLLMAQKHRRPSRILILFFQDEAKRLSHAWDEVAMSLTREAIYVAFTFCTVSLIFCSSLIINHDADFETDVDIKTLLNTVSTLAQKIVLHVRPLEAFSDYQNVILGVLAPVLEGFCRAIQDSQNTSILQSITQIFALINRTLDSEQVTDEEQDGDPQIAPEFDFSIISASDQVAIRNHWNLAASETAWRSSTTGYIRLIASMSQHAEDSRQDQINVTEEVSQLTDLSTGDFIRTGSLVRKILSQAASMSTEGVEKLLNYVSGDNFLGSYNWERCETSLTLCVDILSCTVRLWCGVSASANLKHCALQIYHWIIEIIVGESFASPQLQVRIATLLLEVHGSETKHTIQGSVSSARTVLFKLLLEGSLQARYYITCRLPRLLDEYEMEEHDTIFEDIHAKLPQDIEWIEGIHLRLFAYSKIGTRCFTLLRRCIYHIFETAGLVEDTSWYASSSLMPIVNILKLEDASQLFKLFSSQLLFTWLESHSIQSIPYSAFNYTTLEVLVSECRSEALAIALLQDSATNITELTNLLHLSVASSLTESFSQIAAYAIAHDIVAAGLSHAPARDTEAQLKTFLGKAVYSRLLNENYPCIIGFMFIRLDQEDLMEKSISRNKEYGFTYAALKSMRQLGGSPAPLPPGQQPSFKAKSLCSQLERLRRRLTIRDSDSLWQPFTVVTVLRMLLTEIRKPFGSTHMRRTIYRIRILISLSGAVCFNGYPLEMLLNGLISFIADDHCYEDAIGTIEYVLKRGKEYLRRQPAYTVGICFSAMITSKQENNKLGPGTAAVRIAKMSKVETAMSLKAWLCDFLTENIYGGVEHDLKGRFRALVDAMRALQPLGSTEQSASIKVILTELLQSPQSTSTLFQPSSINQCLRLFVASFTQLSSSIHGTSILHKDAVLQRDLIWKYCSVDGESDEYYLWAGLVLGRAYIEDGRLPRTCKSTDSDLGGFDFFRPFDTSHFGTAICQLLISLLHSSSQIIVEHAENSLISILRHSKTEELKKIVGEIPEKFKTALSFPESLTLDLHFLPTIQAQLSDLNDCFKVFASLDCTTWIHRLSTILADIGRHHPLLQSLPHLLSVGPGLAKSFYPLILHTILSMKSDSYTALQDTISWGYHYCLKNVNASVSTHAAILIESILYLRKHPKSDEKTSFERNLWLSLDFIQVSTAAELCDMSDAALLFLEIQDTMDRMKITSLSEENGLDKSAGKELLRTILTNISEPDGFYGVEQRADFNSLAKKAEFEGNHIQRLFLASAEVDNICRSAKSVPNASTDAILQSLLSLNMNSISQNLISLKPRADWDFITTSTMVNAASRLRQWDLQIQTTNTTPDLLLYQVLQQIHKAGTLEDIFSTQRSAIGRLVKECRNNAFSKNLRRRYLQALAVLATFEDLTNDPATSGTSEALNSSYDRDSWIVANVTPGSLSYLSSKAVMQDAILSNEALRSRLGLSYTDALKFSVESLLHVSKVMLELGAVQECFSNLVQLSNLCDQLLEQKINVKAAVAVQSATVLWTNGEQLASIKLLQETLEHYSPEEQAIQVQRSHILATLAERISFARLETAESVLSKYLSPALDALHTFEGPEAGFVFHTYASYCYGQIQSQENIEELERNETLFRQRKTELRDLENLYRSSRAAKDQQDFRASREKTRRWLAIDEREYHRLKDMRKKLVIQCLGNCLKSLAAWDRFDRDVLTFLATWFGHSRESEGNLEVSAVILSVPSKKFIPVINQLSSRLQLDETKFQKTLHSLLERICQEHPHHGMHHIFASSQPSEDRTPRAKSRHAAAAQLSIYLRNSKESSTIWSKICSADDLYTKLAKFKASEIKQGSRISLNSYDASRRVMREVPTYELPPITQSIPIESDLDYSSVPYIVKINSHMDIPGGISVPKILTLVTSKGSIKKEIFKGGTDDLRQDCVMEQVFTQVSGILKTHKSTRQRHLEIRTYNVMPLDDTSGVIEFVQPTIPLHEFLVNAHEKYHPKDLLWKSCREKVQAVQDQDLMARVRVFVSLKARFRPVLRHFFFERFAEPIDWFERRLSYTRSTATISIIGHILGLGDRHCQNILLDTDTGQVVHIDLGVAFEAGRVLPKPELVPFRLTRDIIDGFGLLGTEGVFRRCSAFTLGTLRENKDIIMTLLNVLRYDPLYAWSMSPLRARRLQGDALKLKPNPRNSLVEAPYKRSLRHAIHRGLDFEASEEGEDDYSSEIHTPEADRALSIVEKKLSVALSAEATVNELIQQAIDDKNLAILFYGWAAFA